jgi:hypothetical protein
MRRIIILGLLVMPLLFGCGKSAQEKVRYTQFDEIIDHSKPLAIGVDRVVHVFCDPAIGKLWNHLSAVV